MCTVKAKQYKCLFFAKIEDLIGKRRLDLSLFWK